MQNRTRLHIASCLALVVTAMILMIRQHVTNNVVAECGIDREMFGQIGMMAFYGLALSVITASSLLDMAGMRRLLLLAVVLHLGGLTAFMTTSSYPVLKYSMLVAGFGNGLVEAVINPLCATTYPDQKTHKMNVLHAWWPGGLIIGGFLAYLMTQMGWSWRTHIGIILIPTVVYAVLILTSEFPPTERVKAGVLTSEMFKEALRPGFLLLAGCMMLTAGTEVAPNNWMEPVMQDIAGMSGTILFVYGSALMFILRFFAGPLAKKISPIGMMWASSAVSGIGLFWLSRLSSPLAAVAAATVFYLGVCFMWPTMLGITAERYAKGGAFTLGVMGFIGNFSIGTLVAKMGSIYQNATTEATAGIRAEFAEVAGKAIPVDLAQRFNLDGGAILTPELARELSETFGGRAGAASAFQTVGYLPVILFFIFGAWWIRDYFTGGYKVVELTTSSES